jgi:hypothetical protein
VAICERLIDAYALSETEASAPSGMWSHELFHDRQRELVQALGHSDAARLADLLASMFRSDFVLGMAQGSMGVEVTSRFNAKIMQLNTLNKLVALAESVGAARCENPEQGSVGIAFMNGVEALMENIETALGVSLDFPDIGAAYGIRMAGRLITPDAPDQVYSAARLREAIRTYLPDRDALRVVEIGGGYGGMAYWLLRMTDVAYRIIDLPVVNVLQGYFLAHAFGPSEVSFHGETSKRVAIMPTHALASIELPFDVIVNKDSMPEIPEGALMDYLSWARAGCDGIFYSYNQEAAAPFDGMPQNVVPEALRRVGGFVRVRRDPSWLRRGYAEEIYRAVGSATDYPVSG